MFSKIILKIIHIPRIIRTIISNFLNPLFFRINRIELGKGAWIIGDVSIDNHGDFTIGDNFNLTSGDSLNPISTNSKACFYIEQNAKVTIGERVGMASPRLWISKGLSIGNRVAIGANVLIIDTDCHQIDYRVRHGLCKYEESPAPEEHKKIQTAPIVIEDNVWIGAHSIILKGVTIGARSIIGAGSVVTHDIPADCIAAGNPCKIVRYINSTIS